MRDFIKNLKFTWNYVKDEKKYLILVIFAYLFNIIISILLPVLSAKIVIGLTSNDYIQIFVIALAIFIVELFNSFANLVSVYYSSKMYNNILSRIGIDVGNNILKIENSCLEKKGNGVFIQRMTNDTSKLADIFNNLMSNVSGFIKCIGILIAIFLVNNLVFVYVLFFSVVLYLIEDIRTKKRKENDKIHREANEKATGLVGELVRGASDIKMLNSEDDFMEELSLKIKDANDKKLKMAKCNLKYRIGMWDISSFGDFVLIILLIVLLKRGIILPSIALVLYNYAGNVSGSAYYIGSFLEQIKDFNLSCERVFEIINGNGFEKEKFGNVHLDRVNGDFEFKDVTFAYSKNKVLNKLSFKVNANETVAFVGKSGAGKTTIFNLLCKMYDINSGKITIDGIDINDLDKDSIRGNITIISQSPYIFNMSIRDNLRLVKRNLTDKEMKSACKMACLDEYINSLPDKYDTIIGEGGINLSGGQRQRLAIARALVQKTEIILFDEATSALDNETQEKIQEAINNMKNEYTILIIAHRLSTIINADRILFLEDGKIIAEGSHSYLLDNCDSYRKLYEAEIKNRK